MSDEEKQSTTSDTALASGTIPEVVLAFVLVLALTVGLDLSARFSGIIASNLLLLVAATFILVPMVLLRRRGRSDLEYGLAFERWQRGVGTGLLALVAIVVLYTPAHYVWSTQVENRTLIVRADNLRGPPDAFFGEPLNFPTSTPQVFTRGNRTLVAWQTPEQPWSLTLQSDTGTATSFNALQRETPPESRIFSGREARKIVVPFYPTGRAPLIVSAQVGDEPLTAEAFRLGAGERSPAARFIEGQSLRVPQSFWWIMTLLLSQLVLVALPEEFFYRGYLQERLSEAMGRKRLQIGPLFLTWPIVITSALFALGHVAIGLAPGRAAVFFPSLLFGYLREKSGGITAPLIFHAGCNMLMYLLEAHYFGG